MLRLRPAVAGFALFSALTIAASQLPAEHDGPVDVTQQPAPLVAATPDPGNGTAAAPSPTDETLRRADSHLNSGRELYFEGNLAGARKEFDAAVDALLSAPNSLPEHARIERRLDEICDLIYRFDVEKLGAGRQEDANVAFDKAPIDEISHMTFPVDPNLAPKLKSELNQTASGIPLELSDPVLGFVHYFSTDRGRHTLLAGMRRAGRYRPLIERILAEEGVPQELVYLAQAESGFLPRAISYKRAVGMWQFIAGTGATYNLNRTNTYDDRFDPEKATRAAARYLKDLYNRYGDWYLAMAAYNCGAGAVDRAVERTGYADYWQLLKHHALPRETANYVPIIVAMMIMGKNPGDYGLQNVDTDAPVEYDTIHLTAPTNLNLVADATFQPLSVIRDLNPSLLAAMAPAGFDVHVPKGASQATEAALETVPASERQAWRLHHVEAGDTLAAIAKSYHLSPERIVAVNGQSDALEAGDTLLIPAVYHPEIRPRAQRTTAKRAHGKTARFPSSRATIVHRSTHVAASRRIAPQVLHRKAAVHTASLHR
jgi:membrane-bound lytic murein transglycosylase D